MKKTNNKGFSLVELIIVIAIMAILAGAIAPALIKYIDNSRKSNDTTSCDTIDTAISTAMANEYVYEYLTSGTAVSKNITNGTTNSVNATAIIQITPGKTTAADGVTLTVPSDASLSGGISADDVKETIFSNIGESTPKIKYKKAADKTNTPSEFVVYISEKGTIYTGMGDSGAMMYEISPEICNDYQ